MIYLDHSATTPIRREALEAMWPYLTTAFGNPSSHHEVGRLAASGLEAARAEVAAVLGARSANIVFTSGGTEANNLAIAGTALARPKGRHIVTAATEHKAVLETCETLRRTHGFAVTVVPVDHDGVLDMSRLLSAITPSTTLCSIAYANNEVGTVTAINEIGRICRELGVVFHTDAVQAAGLLSLDVGDLDVDLMSISGHKFGGPKGSGALFVRSGCEPVPVTSGGGQERGMRSGTQNVAAAVGLATALKLADTSRDVTVPELTRMRDRLIDGVLAAVPEATLTGHRTKRLAHHASFCFNGVNGESVLLELEMSGIICSSGSACAAGSDEASHVLLAMGYPPQQAKTAVRFTLGAMNTQDEIDSVVTAVPEAFTRVRALAS